MMWLKQLFSRRHLYSDLSEEIREHLEEKIEETPSGGDDGRKPAGRRRRECKEPLPHDVVTEQSPVTLRGLLTHTAGLTVHGFAGYAAGARHRVFLVLAAIAR